MKSLPDFDEQFRGVIVEVGIRALRVSATRPVDKLRCRRWTFAAVGATILLVSALVVSDRFAPSSLNQAIGMSTIRTDVSCIEGGGFNFKVALK